MPPELGDNPPAPDDGEPKDAPAPNLDPAFGFADDSWLRNAGRAVQPASPMGSLAGYALVAELGRGGQGSVYKAVQPGTGRIVAIKRLGSAVLLGERQNERFRERYRAEIEAITRLRHPCIVTVHTAEVLDGHPALVMEFIDGQTIDRWADEQWSASHDPLRAILACFLRVCEGVSHAHQRGVIHRDLKPSNIMVEHAAPEPDPPAPTPDGPPPAPVPSQYPQPPLVKILDFGIARLFDRWRDSGASTFTGFAGTPAYASPEQLASRGRGLDTRSDVYSLGVLLCRLLSGAEPFTPDASIGELLESLSRGQVHRPSRCRAGLPRELDLIALKATQLEAADRYQSVDALSSDIHRFLDGRPIAAHPPSRAYLIRKFIRRHRAACALGAVAILAIASLAALSTIQAWHLANKSRDLTESLRIQREAAKALEKARTRAESQEALAIAEGERQRHTADFLLGLVQNISTSSEGRATIPIDRLAEWTTDPLAQGAAFVDPATLARLHLGVATMYNAGARNDLAVTHDRAAIKLLTRPEDAELRLGALVQLASHQRSGGAASPALASIRKALDGIQQAGLSDSPLQIRALRQFSLTLARSDQPAEAIDALRRALAIVDQTNQPAETRALVLSDMASRHFGGRDFEASIQVARDAIACIPESARPDSEACWRATVTLGMIAFRRGQLDDAEQLFSSASQHQTRVLGDGHIRTRNAMRWHARTLHELGRYDEAARILERLLQLVPPTYEAADMGTWQTRFRYAATLLGQGRSEEADRQLRLAITRGGSRTPDALDADLALASSSLAATNLHFTSDLRTRLAHLAWLVDQITDPTTSTDTNAAAESPEPP